MKEETVISYRICPHCNRAVPASSQEYYCLNDGERLLEACPRCKARFTSPYARFCGTCGLDFTLVLEEREE
ncbi:zinc ribbon domain-containing protein [Meiothermus sp.]|uniref:zinc ribbon domain-containing protein n=1 Tax=Meiothermus sp. TaxID=1955249 RepID=UPI00307CCF67